MAPQGLAVPWQDEIGGITAPTPDVQGRHSIPNLFDVTVTFNSQRFRARRVYSDQPEDGVLRVAFLGDSFVFGFGAEDAETYPAQVEALLAQQLPQDSPWHSFEALNAGSGGTGTGEQALFFEHWVRRFAPQVVVLNVVSNDLHDDAGRGLFGLDQAGVAQPRARADLQQADTTLRRVRTTVRSLPLYGFLAQHSHLLALLRNAGSRVLARLPAPESPQAGDAVERAVDPVLLAAEVAWLDERVQATGARLLVHFLPSRESIYRGGEEAPWADDVREQTELITSALTRVCTERGIPYRDLSAPMKALALSREEQDLYYSGLDTHPTPRGYKAFARIFLEEESPFNKVLQAH